MGKVKKTYRLEQNTIDYLVSLASDAGLTVTEALERAILAYGSEPDVCHTQEAARDKAVDVLSEELTRLHSQLDAKDRQIDRLTDALADAQATAKAAQALHAATAQTLALESAAQKKSRFKRLLEALRG